jgi:hypothetical protein
VDYGLEDWPVFRKIVCSELRDVTKGYSMFTGYETCWEGTPDSPGRVFHVDAWSSISATRKPTTKTCVMTGDFRLRMLIPFKIFDLMELKMLLDALFVQSQQWQSIVQLRKCIIYTNPEDYDSQEPQEGTSSEGSAPKENEVRGCVNHALIPKALVEQ